MPPILSGFSFQSRQQYSLCAVHVHMVFTMMAQQKMDFGKLDAMREKDAKLFEAAVDLLFSVGFDNLTDDIVTDVLNEVNENFDTEKSPVDEMCVLVAKMIVLCAAFEIREVSLPALLDYITEKGWRA